MTEGCVEAALAGRKAQEEPVAQQRNDIETA